MSFFKQVYEVVKQIPKGKVATYGQIAKMLGAPRRSQIVGYALHVNPNPGNPENSRIFGEKEQVSEKAKIFDNKTLSKTSKRETCDVIPCHRVVNRFGMVCTGFAFGGADEQRKRLEAEGIVFEKDGTIDLKKYQWNPEVEGGLTDIGIDIE